ncbi:hypothetical protein [Streptomyces sp. SD31]|uniref:hypothetical protein n=1 Tax=Streptomyces sp. SD31 TaxID=3452208 RepID=UPI003F8C9D98
MKRRRVLIGGGGVTVVGGPAVAGIASAHTPAEESGTSTSAATEASTSASTPASPAATASAPSRPSGRGNYVSRVVHVHTRVHTDVTLTGDSYTGGEIIHTGQPFFDPDVDTEIQATSPYSENTTRETRLADDGIYDDGGASSGLLTLTALGDSVSDGYKATLTVGVSTA